MVGTLVLAAAAVGVYELLSGSSRAKIAGMPAAVSAALGRAPLVVTLHGSVLELLSQPTVDQLSGLESSIGAIAGVRRVYGPVAWLRAQIAQLTREVAAKTTSKVPRAAVLVRVSASGGLTIDDSQLTTTLAFGTQVGPLRSLRWLFPSGEQARIFLRLAPGASASKVGGQVLNLVNSGQLLGITATAR